MTRWQLNIGVNCQWQSRCMEPASTAMKRALNYVAGEASAAVASSTVQPQCGRGGYRVDWIGFDHCIRNKSLRRPNTARHRAGR